tara:strand:- start:481 stop:1074 length:594 start_codon:yes stop_codon:yes gene_type:complete
MRYTIAVSTRLSSSMNYEDKRDSISRDWINLFSNLSINNYILLPNMRKELITEYCDYHSVNGFLLTGGDDLGKDITRDKLEFAALNLAKDRSLKVLGICRGMQIISSFFGGTLKPIDGHLATRHKINDIHSRTVNSYHSLAIKILPKCFNVIYRSNDNSIESISHKSLPWDGCMWHPERDEFIHPMDKKMIESFFSV